MAICKHIIGNIAYIQQVMEYSSVLIDIETLLSEQTDKFAAGWFDPDDSKCTEFY